MIADDIKNAVYAAYEAKEAKTAPRAYLGASSIGRECDREIWYSFRHAQPPNEFPGRMLRLFDHGHTEEDRIVRDLRAAGFTVINQKPEGEQFGFLEHDGMFRGHIDGVVIIDGIPHLLECKTASSKSFEKTKSHGVAKDKPEHYAQMQVYMHKVKGKQPLRKALYFVVNKDNDDIYVELVDYDQSVAERYIARAKAIIDTTNDAPASPGWKCGWCAFRNMCNAHNKAKDDDKPAVNVVNISCRSCCFATLAKGVWSCRKHSKELSFDEQVAGCNNHVFLPDLIGFATPLGFTDAQDGIKYKHENESEFVQGGDSGIPSKALTIFPKNMIDQANQVAMVQDVFGGDILATDEQVPF